MREFKIKITEILEKVVHVLSVMFSLVFPRVQKHFSKQIKIVDIKKNHSNTKFKNLIKSPERIFLSHDEVTNWEYFTNSSMCSSASLRTAMALLRALVF